MAGPNTSNGLVAVILAAGYGTRLEADMRADGSPDVAPLIGVPKPLLPVYGDTPLIDEWIDAFIDCRARASSQSTIDDVLVVVNDLHAPKFHAWAATRGIPADRIVNDGSRSNETRIGAIACLQLVLDRHRDLIGGRDILVVAGDTLFYESFHLASFLESRRRDGDHVLYYGVQEAEVSKRGILDIDGATGRVTGFLEKPKPSETSSRWACPAFYVFRNSSLPLVRQYLDQPSVAGNRDAADAPGRFIQWLHKQTTVYGTRIEGRHDIGNLADYRAVRSPKAVVERAYARIGLIGNPSDGFNGKTISVAIQNYYATVRIRPAASVELVAHPVFDTHIFPSLADLADRTRVFGYYGGLRLLRATCKRFVDRVADTCKVDLSAGCRISYDSNIPFAVGLAGSSAIVTAAFRALMRYYGVTLDMLRLTRDEPCYWRTQVPGLILAIEREELGIVAGLQDRVIQEFDGMVHMDFAADILRANRGAGRYVVLDPTRLPPLYLAYKVKAGGDSGKIHSDARRRFEAGDPFVVGGMQKLGAMADRARACIDAGDYRTLGAIMDENFDLRREIYSDAVTGADNLEAADLARSLGFHAKFTGSGGAFVLLKRAAPDAPNTAASHVLTPAELAHAQARFDALGFAVVPVRVQRSGEPLRWVA